MEYWKNKRIIYFENHSDGFSFANSLVNCTVNYHYKTIDGKLFLGVYYRN